MYRKEYYLAIKKSEIMSFAATRMLLEMITLSKESQTEEDKVSNDISYMRNLKKMIQMDLQTRKGLIDLENKCMVSRGLRGKNEGKG